MEETIVVVRSTDWDSGDEPVTFVFKNKAAAEVFVEDLKKGYGDRVLISVSS